MKTIFVLQLGVSFRNNLLLCVSTQWELMALKCVPISHLRARTQMHPHTRVCARAMTSSVSISFSVE